MFARVARTIIRAFLLGAGMTASAVALAQAAPPPPPQVNQVAPTREEIERPAGETAAPPRARLVVEGDIERAPCALADPAYADINVTLTEATFANLGPVSPETLRPAWQRYAGQTLPLSVICEIRDAAATILRREGYLAAVQVPVQRIEGGNVRFEVLFAKLSAVRVRGDAGRAEPLIAAYLNKLTAEPLFNRYQAERYLLLARDLPGYEVRLALRPTGQAPGDMVGEVTVSYTPVVADLNVQNLAGRDTGRWGGQLRAQFHGLSGMGDRTTLALYSTADFEEQQVLQLGHEMRLGGEGLTIGGRFTYAWTEPHLPAGSPDLRARTLFYSLEAGYPFVRTQYRNLRGALGLDMVNQRVRFAGAPLTKDRLRVAYLRLDGDVVDDRGGIPQWRAAGSFELRRGLSIFDATKGCNNVLAGCPAARPSRLDGDPTATLMRAQAIFEAKLGANITASISPRAQLAFDPLLSFEEYAAGNYTIGRGYDPGTLIGDSGVGYSVELRMDRWQLSPSSTVTLQPFIFGDAAWVWNRNVPGRIDPEKLASAGGGLRASFADKLRLDVTLAAPLRRAGLQAKRGDPRLLVSLTTRLLPWGAR